MKPMVATSVEQSEKLVDAGIPAEDTADYYYDSRGELCWRGEPILFMLASFQTPAWSLSALWNLCNDTPLSFSTDEDSAEDVIESIVNHLIKSSPQKS